MEKLYIMFLVLIHTDHNTKRKTIDFEAVTRLFNIQRHPALHMTQKQMSAHFQGAVKQAFAKASGSGLPDDVAEWYSIKKRGTDDAENSNTGAKDVKKNKKRKKKSSNNKDKSDEE